MSGTEVGDLSWTDISVAACSSEVQVASAYPIRYRHRQRTTGSPWLDGLPADHPFSDPEEQELRRSVERHIELAIKNHGVITDITFKKRGVGDA